MVHGDNAADAAHDKMDAWEKKVEVVGIAGGFLLLLMVSLSLLLYLDIVVLI